MPGWLAAWQAALQQVFRAQIRPSAPWRHIKNAPPARQPPPPPTIKNSQLINYVAAETQMSAPLLSRQRAPRLFLGHLTICLRVRALFFKLSFPALEDGKLISSNKENSLPYTSHFIGIARLSATCRMVIDKVAFILDVK
jgi:hypothetical protein